MEVDAVAIWWSVLLMCQAWLWDCLTSSGSIEPRRIRSVLSKQGIRGPRPTFPFGNVPEMQKIQSTMINNTHEGFDGQHLNRNWLPSVFPYTHEWEREYGTVLWNPLLRLIDLIMKNKLIWGLDEFAGPIYMYSTGINQHLYVRASPIATSKTHTQT